MTSHADKATRFLALHRQDRPLLMANAWDDGSAKLLASLGYQALATTSSGYAATLGRLDYRITREESIGHAAALAERWRPYRAYAVQHLWASLGAAPRAARRSAALPADRLAA